MFMDPDQRDAMSTNLTFEINPNHEFIVGLNKLRKTDVSLASELIKQNLNTCLLETGLLKDHKSFIEGNQRLLMKTLNSSLNFSNSIESEEASRPVEEEVQQHSSSNQQESKGDKPSPESILEQAIQDMMKEEGKQNKEAMDKISEQNNKN